MLLPLPRRVLRFAVDPAGEFLCLIFTGGAEAELHDLRRPRAPAWRLADTEAAAFVVPEAGDGGAPCATLARGPALLIFLRISSVAFVWVVRLTPRSRLASGT